MARPSSPSGEWARAGAASQRACTATVDERGIVTGWSEGAGRLLGYGPDEVVGHPAARLLAGDVGDRARRVAAGRRRWSGTALLQHRDGRRLQQRLLAHRRDSGAAAAEWLVLARTAGGPSTTPGEVLPPGGVFGEWVLRQLPCVVGVFDSDLRLVGANAVLEGALSLTEEEMRGWRLAELAPHPSSDRAEAAMRLVLEGNGVQHVADLIGPGGVGTEGAWPASLAPLAPPEKADAPARAVCLVAHPSAGAYPARQRMLLQGQARIGTTGDPERTARELAEVVVPAVADFAAVEVLDYFWHGGGADTTGPTGRVRLSRIAVRSVLGETGVLAAAGESVRYPAGSPVARCLTEGRAAVYGAGEPAIARWADEDPQAAWIGRAEVRSVMVVPLRAQSDVVGAVLLGRHRRREPFDADDMWLGEQLAGTAAEAIHRARRGGREHTTTVTLQRSLLPQTFSDQQALDVATRYLPAGGRAGVGGDWFDVIPLSGSRVALVVGDVVGHGIRASATMGRVRTAVRTLADVDMPPDELLTHLDDLVVHLSAEEAGPEEAVQGAAGIGTTCLYAVYDPISRHLTLARAGHPPPAVVAPDGTVHFLDVPPGPPLGLGGLPFETMDTELAEGSLIALYTDGLLQARDHDIDEALDKMFATLARPASTPDAVCDRLLTAMLTHPPDDDVALLVARSRCLGADRVATWELTFDPTVVAQVRRLAADQLAAWQLEEAGFVTELVVSELVTNALRYGREPARLRMIHEGRNLICEVFDSSSTAPHLRRARVFDEGGRGLLLVAQLTQRWGTRHEATGKTVWAEQLLTPG
ncbi:SpoIIE family protein phosphatase [Streptomyces bicolor]|uniref:SpoIIE family protein phosphatase n=1 Tax=Streptomyces bicolor TaxID=66874 RepID=UPI00055A9DC0|nr:SpoIIE family protein phosphatase [Streptomyces bicolor]